MAGSRILGPDEYESIEALWSPEQVPAGSAPSDDNVSGPVKNTSELEINDEDRDLKAAHEAGYQLGLEEGTASAQREENQYSEWNARLAANISELAELRADLRREAMEDLVRLSLGIAERILHREVNSDPEALKGVLNAALERINRADLVTVHAHPQHVAVLERALSESAPASPVEVSGDPNLAHGSVILETTRGTLDASIDSQLDEIRSGLTDRLRR